LGFLLFINSLLVYGQQILWEATWVKPGNQTIKSIVTSDGIDFLGVGDDRSPGLDFPSVIKFDSSRNFIWQRNFNLTGLGEGFGGKISKIPREDYKYIVSGFGKIFGVDKDLIFKIDSSGNTIWEKTFGHINLHNLPDQIVLNNKSILACGMREYPGTSFDPYLLCLDSLGNTLWEQTIFMPGAQELLSLIDLYDGSYLVSGKSDSAHYLRQFDLNGLLIWDTLINPVGGDVTRNLLVFGQDSTFYLGGWSNINNNSFPGELISFKNNRVQWRIDRDEGAEHYLINNNNQIISEKTDLLLPVQGLEILNDTISQSLMWWPLTLQWKAFRDLVFFGNNKLMAAGQHMVSAGNSNYWISAVSGVGDEWIPDPCEISPPLAGFSWSYTNPTLTLVDTSYSGLEYLDTLYYRSWTSSLGDTSSGDTMLVFWDTASYPNMGIELIVGNWYGCRDTLNLTLTYEPTGISQSIHYDWKPKIFPNPFNRSFALGIEGKNLPNEPVFFELFDLKGNRLLEENFQSKSKNFQLSELPAGVYLARITYLAEIRYERVLKW
jgi:Secretion system C-terminal sorting domain